MWIFTRESTAHCDRHRCKEHRGHSGGQAKRIRSRLRIIQLNERDCLRKTSEPGCRQGGVGGGPLRCEELGRHARFPCRPWPRPTVMIQRPPPARPRHRQPIGAPEPADGLDDITAASTTDLFSGMWNPAFVKRHAAPAGGVYSEHGPNGESD